MSAIRAWRVFVKPWGYDRCGVYGAEKRSTVVARALRSANDVGYGLRWNDFRVVREPEFDTLVAKHGMVCWSDDYAAIMRGAELSRLAQALDGKAMP